MTDWNQLAIDAEARASHPLETLPEFNGPANDRDVLVDIAQLLTELLAEFKHLRSSLGNTARSSVELSENAKGGVQLGIKTYVDSGPVDSALTESIAAFYTAKQEIERGLMNGWRTEYERVTNDER